MDVLRPTVFFSQNVAIIKTNSATITFFLLLVLSFDDFSLKRLQISLGWFSKNRLDNCFVGKKEANVYLYKVNNPC